MSGTIHSPECREIADALWPIAAKAKVKNGHWISTPEGEYQTYHGNNEWCRDCGTFMIRHLRRKDRKNARDYILDGGWSSEHDTTIACTQCGVRLRSTLLSCGASEELDYFRDNPPRPGNPDDAYDFHEVLTAFEYAKADEAEMVAEAVEIGRALVAAMVTSVLSAGRRALDGGGK